MVEIGKIFKRLKKKRVLVVGDFALDAYIKGKVGRISPEAPVPVLKVEEEDARPGMAGNVVLNLLALGMEVAAFGRVGADSSGEEILALLQKAGCDTSGMLEDTQCPTPLKKRVIAGGQQLMRLDTEEVVPLSDALEKRLLEKAREALNDCDVVAISDYAKGLSSSSLFANLSKLASEKGIPVIVDPKGKDFSKYGPVSLIKPNKKEAYLASGLDEKAPLALAAKEVLAESRAKCLMVTCSGEGIRCFDREENESHFPVKVREVVDVTGAGDTVLAVVSASLANGLSLGEAATLSNLAAGIAIEHFGCARVTLSEMAQRALEDDRDSKVFDEKHLFVLKAALEGLNPVLLTLENVESLTPDLFSAIEEMSDHGKIPLIVYMKGERVSDAFVSMLSSLRQVRFVVLEGEGVEALFQTIPPSNTKALSLHCH